MGMKLLEKIRKAAKLTNYGIAKELNNMGVKITIPGVDAYERDTAKSMRLDVLCGLKRLSGKDWVEFGKLLDDEFGVKK
jgi:hypothetical protein